MAKTPLIVRMEKAGAPKTWIAEVKRTERQLKDMTELKNYYVDIIDVLARQLENEQAALAQFETVR